MVDTTATTQMLKKLGRLATTTPEDFVLHPGVAKIIEDRRANPRDDLLNHIDNFIKPA